MASRSLGVLTLDLVAKVGGFVKGMDAAERASEKWRKQVDKNLKATATAFAAAGTAYAAFAVHQAKAAIDSADALSKQSKAVGIAVEDLSALNYAAELSDVSVEQLSGSLNKFNRIIDDSADGTGAGAEAFDALGISIKNADGTLKGNLDLVKEVADAFQEMPDGIQKSAIAQDLFGKSGTKLIPLLNDGSAGLAKMADEAARLGLIIDGDTAAAAEQFNDDLTRLQKQSDALGIAIATELLPSVTRITSAMVDAAKESGVLEAAWVGLGGILAEGLGLNDSAEQQIRSIQKLLNGDLFDRVRFFGKDGFVEYYSEEELRAELAKLRDIVKSEAASTPTPVGGAAPADSGPSKEFKSRIEDLQRELSLHGEVGKAAQLRYDIENGLIANLLPGEGERLIKLQQQIDARTAATKAIEDQKEAQRQLSESVESELTALERAAVVWGMNAEEVKLYDLALQGADDQQLELARSLLDTVSGMEQQKEAQENYLKVVADLRTEEEQRSDTLREQLAIIEAMAAVPSAERSEQISRAAAGAFEDSPDFSGLAPEVGGAGGEVRKANEAAIELENWYAEQLSMLEHFREDRSDLNAEWDEQELALKQEHENRLAEIERARNMASLAVASEIFGNLQSLSQSENKKLVAISKAAATAQAVVSGAQAFMNALAVPPYPLGVALAATSAIATATQIAAINGVAFSGQAHDGIMSVPASGTWNLEKGERVLPQDTAANLDSVLADIRGSQRGSDTSSRRGSTVVNQTINTTGRIDARTSNQVASDAARKQRTAQARLG